MKQAFEAYIITNIPNVQTPIAPKQLNDPQNIDLTIKNNQSITEDPRKDDQDR